MASHSALETHPFRCTFCYKPVDDSRVGHLDSRYCPQVRPPAAAKQLVVVNLKRAQRPLDFAQGFGLGMLATTRLNLFELNQLKVGTVTPA